MRIDRMGPDEVQRCWPWLTQLLRPSVEPDGSLATVRALLLSGAMGIASIHGPGVAGLVVLHPGNFEGEFCLSVAHIAGRLRGGPKHMLKTMREIMAHFVAEARKAGCAAVLIDGRNYRNIFRDFEQFDPEHPNRLRKVLT